MKKTTVLLTAVLFTQSGCFSDEKAEQKNQTICTDPRPAVCTMDYTPVCGLNKDQTVKTYSNGCGACSNPEVISYLPEACPENP